MELAITIISVALKALEVFGPDIVAAITGGQTADEAIAAAHAAAAKVPKRVEQGAADLAARKARGEADTEPPALVDPWHPAREGDDS